MSEYVDKEFFSVVDRGQLNAEGISFRNCQFVNCGFSLVDNIADRSLVRRVRIFNCHLCNSFLGPGVIEDLTVEGLTSDDTVTCYGTLFRHATFIGRIGKVSISKQASPWSLSVPIQRQFDVVRAEHYNEVDWALDISDAHFDELDINGIPSRAIKIDPSRHFVLNRRNATCVGWRSQVTSRSEYWLFVIDEFLQSDDESTVLAAPRCESKTEQVRIAEGLLELRELGVLL